MELAAALPLVPCAWFQGRRVKLLDLRLRLSWSDLVTRELPAELPRRFSHCGRLPGW